MRRFSAWSVWLGDSGQCFQELSGMCSRERGNCVCAEIAQKWQHLADLRQYNFSEDPKCEAYSGVPRDWNKIIRIGLVTALIKAEQCTGIRKRCCYSGKGWPLLLVPKVLSSFRPKCSLLHLGSRIQHFQPGTREQQLSRAKDPSPKGAATMETSIDFPQKIKNRTTIWSSNLTFGYIDKGDEIPISRIYLHSHVWKF